MYPLEERSTPPSTPGEKYEYSMPQLKDIPEFNPSSYSPPPTLVKDDHEFNVLPSSSSPATAEKKKILVEKSGNRKRKMIGKAPMTKKKFKKQKSIVKTPVPELPERMMDYINNVMEAKDLTYLNSKGITASDTKPQQNRLYLPVNELEEFLNEKEIDKIHKSTPREPEIVHVLGSHYNFIYKLHLSHWPSLHRYQLNGKHYTEFVTNNKAKPKVHTADIWVFRDGESRICFAINFRAITTEVDDGDVETDSNEQLNTLEKKEQVGEL